MARLFSDKKKVSLLVHHMRDKEEDARDILILLQVLFRDIPHGDQEQIVNACIDFIFNGGDELRVGARKFLSRQAMYPEYAYIIDEIFKKRKKIDTRPAPRATVGIALIVCDCFQDSLDARSRKTHGDMVLSRILAGFLGKEIDLTKDDYLAQLGISGERLSVVDAAKKILKLKGIELLLIEEKGNSKSESEEFTKTLQENQGKTTVVNISMVGTIMDPQKVNGGFSMEVFTPSIGRDHVFFFSAGNGRVSRNEVKHETNEEGRRVILGMPRIYSHPRLDQFVFVGAAHKNPQTGQWERDQYSDYGPDVREFAPIGSWSPLIQEQILAGNFHLSEKVTVEGTSFSAPYATGLELRALVNNSLMSTQMAQSEVLANPNIQTSVKYDQGNPEVTRENHAMNSMDNAMSESVPLDKEEYVLSVILNSMDLGNPDNEQALNAYFNFGINLPLDIKIGEVLEGLLNPDKQIRLFNAQVLSLMLKEHLISAAHLPGVIRALKYAFQVETDSAVERFIYWGLETLVINGHIKARDMEIASRDKLKHYFMSQVPLPGQQRVPGGYRLGFDMKGALKAFHQQGFLEERDISARYKGVNALLSPSDSGNLLGGDETVRELIEAGLYSDITPQQALTFFLRLGVVTDIRTLYNDVKMLIALKDKRLLNFDEIPSQLDSRLRTQLLGEDFYDWYLTAGMIKSLSKANLFKKHSIRQAEIATLLKGINDEDPANRALCARAFCCLIEGDVL
ncbi:MAG: hypothetical protein HQL13_08695, partial [Candidatus Omnitrophica bacterium]|nr:hypothetical protein [Candidatus Omnitrophota bacterium]